MTERALPAVGLALTLTLVPADVARALDVLLANAFSTAREGAVRVRVARVPDTQLLRFEVSDSGGGIPWNEQPAIHGKIRQATAEATSGLELAAVLAREMGGELEFESQPGSGSRFWFTAECRGRAGALVGQRR